jgi:opacity protein-like surface antigen
VKSNSVAVTLVALGAFAGTSAFADNEGGLYLGAGIGQFNVEIDDVVDVPSTVESFDGDDTAYKVFAGWRFNPYIGIELDYVDLGGPDDEVEDVRVEAEINGIAPYLIGTLPLGPIELFGKVGYYFYDVELNAENIGSVDDSNEDLVYGAGIGLTLFGHLHARLEYEIIDISEVDDANALWLSGAWRF